MISALFRASWVALRRDRAALALSFVVPVVFFSVFAVIFGGDDGRDATRRVKLPVVDEDRSERSVRLLAALEREPALDVRRAPGASSTAGAAPYDRAAAEAAVRGGEAGVALVVPAGFGAGQLAFGPRSASDRARARLELLADRADPIAHQMVAGLLQKVAFTAMPDQLIDSGVESLDRIAAFTPEQRERLARFSAEVGGAPTGEQGAGALVEIEVHDLLGGARKRPMVAFYAAGLGVMFLMFTAAGAGGALIEERESGTLDRVLSTRMSMTGLLAGKLLYLAALGVAQLVVMFAWGVVVFGLELEGKLLGLAAMALPTALAASAFGLVLAALSKSRKQLVALSNLVILTLSAIGGSMFPRFLMPVVVQKVSLVAFNSWALEGFLDVLWRERPLVAIVPEIAVLLGWSALFFLLARRLARKWELV